MINLNQFAEDVHQNAVEHGWWEEERSFGDICALIHSEVSEALEEYRNNMPAVYYNPEKPDKPEGTGIEFADVIIRILDYCGKMGWDIESFIQTKHAYNKTRPYKHGGKVI